MGRAALGQTAGFVHFSTVFGLYLIVKLQSEVDLGNLREKDLWPLWKEMVLSPEAAISYAKFVGLYSLADRVSSAGKSAIPGGWTDFWKPVSGGSRSAFLVRHFTLLSLVAGTLEVSHGVFAELQEETPTKRQGIEEWKDYLFQEMQQDPEAAVGEMFSLLGRAIGRIDEVSFILTQVGFIAGMAVTARVLPRSPGAQLAAGMALAGFFSETLAPWVSQEILDPLNLLTARNSYRTQLLRIVFGSISVQGWIPLRPQRNFQVFLERKRRSLEREFNQHALTLEQAGQGLLTQEISARVTHKTLGGTPIPGTGGNLSKFLPRLPKELKRIEGQALTSLRKQRELVLEVRMFLFQNIPGLQDAFPELQSFVPQEDVGQSMRALFSALSFAFENSQKVSADLHHAWEVKHPGASTQQKKLARICYRYATNETLAGCLQIQRINRQLLAIQNDYQGSMRYLKAVVSKKRRTIARAIVEEAPALARSALHRSRRMSDSRRIKLAMAFVLKDKKAFLSGGETASFSNHEGKSGRRALEAKLNRLGALIEEYQTLTTLKRKTLRHWNPARTGIHPYVLGLQDKEQSIAEAERDAEVKRSRATKAEEQWKRRRSRTPAAVGQAMLSDLTRSQEIPGSPSAFAPLYSWLKENHPEALPNGLRQFKDQLDRPVRDPSQALRESVPETSGILLGEDRLLSFEERAALYWSSISHLSTLEKMVAKTSKQARDAARHLRNETIRWTHPRKMDSTGTGSKMESYFRDWPERQGTWRGIPSGKPERAIPQGRLGMDGINLAH
jgi:hypothetical protein